MDIKVNTVIRMNKYWPPKKYINFNINFNIALPIASNNKEGI